MALCPCGSSKDFDACCGPILGGTPAPTAEALMRSRFTAFATGDLAHIDKTQAIADSGGDRAATSSSAVQWVKLEVGATAGGGEDDDSGTVEFAAHFRQGGRAQVHREKSTFRRIDGDWAYVDGEVYPDLAPEPRQKVGRNDPCLCGSGKKFKKCCGA